MVIKKVCFFFLLIGTRPNPDPDEFELHQCKAYKIAERILLAASESMAVGYKAGAGFQLGQGNPDFSFSITWRRKFGDGLV